MSINPRKAKPEISCGTVGEQIDGVRYPTVGAETTREPSVERFTYWFFWPYDLTHDDGKEDYEPVTLIYRRRGSMDVLEGGVARVHYARVRFKNLLQSPHSQVRFTDRGHTPVLRVGNLIRDITVDKKGDLADAGRKLWVLSEHVAGDASGWDGTSTRSYELRQSSCPPATSRARNAPYF